MAAARGNGAKSTNNRKSTGGQGGKRTQKGARTSRSTQSQRGYSGGPDRELIWEISLIGLFVAAAILFLCNFGVIGPVGDAISGFQFGIFGLTAYLAPLLIFIAVAFRFANEGNPGAKFKIMGGILLFLMVGVLCDLIAQGAVSLDKYSIKEIYEWCSQGRKGGGILAGSLAYLLHRALGTMGCVLVVLFGSAVSLILLTEKSLLQGLREGGSVLRERTREESIRWQEGRESREEARLQREEERRIRAEEKRLELEARENERILRMERKVSGVSANTQLVKEAVANPIHLPGIGAGDGEIHEITYDPLAEEAGLGLAEEVAGEVVEGPDDRLSVSASVLEKAYEPVPIRSQHQVVLHHTEPPVEEEIRIHRAEPREVLAPEEEEYSKPDEGWEMEQEEEEPVRPQARLRPDASRAGVEAPVQEAPARELPAKEYMFPPLSRLQKGKAGAGDSEKELRDTAMRLKQTLDTFGVRVTITDISQGPSVTRYELQPEQGVKVSRIVNLTDDIKLNLAATDIRIEAPIPGKAAIGIEVPNKENSPVALRDLLESAEFREFPSNLAFAVGKDIGGKTVVTDIAKMPHMLIAGATGSGKSVCINTLIMSILYKAHPDDVKLIMIDPKVVELRVYNEIPHLMIPVVTDPKKAAAALQWGVNEMTERYKRFADFNVRDLKGYNQKLETMRKEGQTDVPPKMPQIVIIVDELADLMMVAAGEVEEAICRLAQLARAAGIHLIIATQRPSVDVITGLIKANMPSRVAFAVSSGVDSRTILDMNGAEKLLGKGDMLFYPQNYSKPARIQGAFVSDKEVADVVDFLKNQKLGNRYAEDIEEQMKSMESSGPASGGDDSRDELFAEAGRFIIDKDKASIGMLQRMFRIGFNRAARIMDQLCDYGVVGEEEGTKPRKVLMSMSEFELLLEEL